MFEQVPATAKWKPAPKIGKRVDGLRLCRHSRCRPLKAGSERILNYFDRDPIESLIAFETCMSSMSMSGMSMSISSSPTSTMSGMSMASSASSMDMSSAGTQMMQMDAMAMTFFTSTVTPLFSMAWTPNSAGQYTGTCIFLIALAAIFRALLAIRFNLFEFVRIVKHQHKEQSIYGYGQDSTSTVRPWRAKEAVWIALMDVLLSGVAYLLYVQAI
jgi:copper transporter 1